MLNYQQNHYKHYRILLEDGTEREVTREECFAPAEQPTEDNPYIQRWYYSPDGFLAIRLPRNAMGQAVKQANGADLKYCERSEKRKSACVGQTDKSLCRVTCDDCCYADFCTLPEREDNGYACKEKCKGCTVKKSMFKSMDVPIGEDDSGDPITMEFDAGVNIEDELCRKEEENLFEELMGKFIESLNEADRTLYNCLKARMPLEDIAGLLGKHVNTVSYRRDRLYEKYLRFKEWYIRWKTDPAFRRAYRTLMDLLSEEEKRLYDCIKKEMPLEEIAEVFGKHTNTIVNRKSALKKKFRDAGLEKYF